MISTFEKRVNSLPPLDYASLKEIGKKQQRNGVTNILYHPLSDGKKYTRRSVDDSINALWWPTLASNVVGRNRLHRCHQQSCTKLVNQRKWRLAFEEWDPAAPGPPNTSSGAEAVSPSGSVEAIDNEKERVTGRAVPTDPFASGATDPFASGAVGSEVEVLQAVAAPPTASLLTTALSLIFRTSDLPLPLLTAVLAHLDGDHLCTALLAVSLHAQRAAGLRAAAAETTRKQQQQQQQQRHFIPLGAAAAAAAAAAETAAKTVLRMNDTTTFGHEVDDGGGDDNEHSSGGGRNSVEEYSLCSILGPWTEKPQQLSPSVSAVTDDAGKDDEGSMTDGSSLLWPRFESEWRAFVRGHRSDRQAAMERGDMSVDIECSIWPQDMGDVEHDPPVWIRDPCNDEAWQAERLKHDNTLLRQHRTLFARLLRQLDGWASTASACCAAPSFAHGLGGNSSLQGEEDYRHRHRHSSGYGASGSGGGGGDRGSGNDQTLTLPAVAAALSDTPFLRAPRHAPSSTVVVDVCLGPLVAFHGGAGALSFALHLLAHSAAAASVEEDSAAAAAAALTAVVAVATKNEEKKSPSSFLSVGGENHERNGGGNDGTRTAAAATVVAAYSGGDAPAPKPTPPLASSPFASCCGGRCGGPREWFTLSLSGCGACVDGSTLLGTVLSQHFPVAARLLELDLRGTTLSLPTTSPRVEEAAVEFTSSVGKACCNLAKLDLSGVLFRRGAPSSVGSSSSKAFAGTGVGDGEKETRRTGLEEGRARPLGDAALTALCRGLAQHQAIRKLSLGGAAEVTDAGLRELGAALGPFLVDLSLYSCYRATDYGVLHLASSKLRRVNFCGCYKVSDVGRRHFINQNSRIIIYNKPRDFGLPHPSEKDFESAT